MSDPILPTSGAAASLLAQVQSAPAPAASADRAAAKPSTTSSEAVAAVRAEARAAASAGAGAGSIAPEEAVEDLKSYLKHLPSDLNVHLDKDSGRTVVKVVNPVTREVVAQFPPDELLNVARRLRQLTEAGKGGLINQDG